MFENAELGHAIDKATYDRESPEVRAALLGAQRELAAADLSVMVIVTGVGGAGKSEAVNLLLEWMDARGIQTHAMREPSDDEGRPAMWRSWQELPPRGRMAISFGAWYARPLLDRVFGRTGRAELDQTLDRIVDFEQMLRREGVLLVKLWLHLSRDAQEARIKELDADPRQRWRVIKRDWKLFRRYDAYRSAGEHVLRRTGGGDEPWSIVEGTDRRHCRLAVARVLLDALRGRLALVEADPPSPGPPEPDRPVPPAVNVINSLDLGLSLDPAGYKKRLAGAQGELGRLGRKLRKRGRSLVLVFEGPDAAGKGGAIRRLTAAMDARDYQVISVSAPTDEERAHPYLWRFWRQLPPPGRVAIFDRSWYGRVLVERVEGFARPDQWRRAFGEINDFEAQLAESGAIVIKFWLAIAPAEQLRRFEHRQATPYKQYKLTPEDWRNRDRWDAYEAAACEMIEKTGSETAPWVLVEADNKEWARVKVLETVVRRVEDAFSS